MNAMQPKCRVMSWRYKNACLLLIGYFINVVVVHLVSSHSCGYVAPKREDVQRVSVETHYSSVHKRSTTSPGLKIYVHFDESVYNLEDQNARKVITNDVIPDAVNFLHASLSVRQSTEKIRLFHQCVTSSRLTLPKEKEQYCDNQGCKDNPKCGEMTIPSEHLKPCRVYDQQTGQVVGGQADGGPGVLDHDFILYVTAVATTNCVSSVAHATHCQQDIETDRPLAGQVNLCPASMATGAFTLDQIHSTVRHEILHSLGFSNSLFAFFRDDEGKPLTSRSPSGLPPYNEADNHYQWSDNTIKDIVRSNWKVRGGRINREVRLLITPRVVREVRSMFGCKTLEGAELEDQGGTSTATSHWEKRIFLSEVMSGSFTPLSQITRVTLALMEDTGWYWANYSMAEEPRVGKNLGCDFVKKSCMDWMQSHSEDPSPFCITTRKNRSSCDEHRTAATHCTLKKYYQSLEGKYQNFNSIPGVDAAEVSMYGSSVDLSDYCPFKQAFVQKLEGHIVRISICNGQQNTPQEGYNYHLEDYGKGSRCFYHKTAFTLYRCDKRLEFSPWGSGCYKHKCVKDLGLVFILGGSEFPCYNQTSAVIVKNSTYYNFKGELVCPPCNEICPSSECPVRPVASPTGAMKMTTTSDTPPCIEIPAQTLPPQITSHSGPASVLSNNSNFLLIVLVNLPTNVIFFSLYT